MSYNLVYSAFAYYTLLINGHKPSAAYNGTYTYHDIECLACPYGGRCSQTITSVPNFWGYVQRERIRFQHCPKDYCCSSTYCQGYDTCAAHRTGTLCGVCGPGYSEALFSASCLPDEKCDVTMLFPLVVGTGLLYGLFLLYQKDIRDFIFQRSVGLGDISIPCLSGRGGAGGIEGGSIKMRNRARSSTRSSGRRSGRGRGCSVPVGESEMFTDSGLQTYEITELDEAASKRYTQRGATHANNNHDERHHQRSSSTSSSTSGVHVDTSPTPVVDTGASFLIIISYYFQDAQLLHLKTVFASADNRSKNMLKQVNNN